MKTILYAPILLFVTAGILHAEGNDKAKKDLRSPTSKLFVASVKGDSSLNNDDRVEELGKASAFVPDNSTIETKDKSSNSMVYSNGAGIYVDENTKLQVKSFDQEPFNTTRDDLESEPSISQTNAYVASGTVGICSPKMAAGSSMVYSTPYASAQIRGKQVAIRSEDKKTTICAFDGEVTVRAGNRSLGGQVIHAGEQAVIQPGPPGQPNVVSISKMDRQTYDTMTEKVSGACQAKKTVVWDTVEQKPKIIAAASATAKSGGSSDGSSSGSGNNSSSSSGTNGTGGSSTSGTPGTDGSTKEIVATPVVPVTVPVTVEVSASSIR